MVIPVELTGLRGRRVPYAAAGAVRRDTVVQVRAEHTVPMRLTTAQPNLVTSGASVRYPGMGQSIARVIFGSGGVNTTVEIDYAQGWSHTFVCDYLECEIVQQGIEVTLPEGTASVGAFVGIGDGTGGRLTRTIYLGGVAMGVGVRSTVPAMASTCRIVNANLAMVQPWRVNFETALSVIATYGATTSAYEPGWAIRNLGMPVPADASIVDVLNLSAVNGLDVRVIYDLKV